MKKILPRAFFFVVVLLVSAAFFGLIGDFILAVFWAIVMTIIFYPRYTKILARFPKKPGLSAGLTLLFILAIVIIPLGGVSIAIVNEASKIVAKISKDDQSLEEHVQDIQESIPIEESQLQTFGLSKAEVQVKLNEILTNGTKFIAAKAITLTQNIFSFFVSFFLMLYMLYFFLKDGKKLVQELVWVLPMGDKQEWTLLMRFESVARATVKGSLLVALVQGMMGGLLFWAVGIPAAFLWGVVMVLASLLPVGSALVWAPWAVAFFLQGAVGKGVVLLVVGAGFIGLIDNFLRPRLVGQDAKMPDYLVLLSTLGGLSWFGLSGFVIGPVIAALFVSCWQMMGKEYGKPYEQVVTAATEEDLDSIDDFEEIEEIAEKKTDQ